MSPETYTIIGVAIALTGLILNGQRTLSASLAELRRDLSDLRSEIPAISWEILWLGLADDGSAMAA